MAGKATPTVARYAYSTENMHVYVYGSASPQSTREFTYAVLRADMENPAETLTLAPTFNGKTVAERDHDAYRAIKAAAQAARKASRRQAARKATTATKAAPKAVPVPKADGSMMTLDELIAVVKAAATEAIKAA